MIDNLICFGLISDYFFICSCNVIDSLLCGSAIYYSMFDNDLILLFIILLCVYI